MNNNPKISVLMTVFNGERFIREAIESILNQTFRDFEFIIVDNASTDKTLEIISSYRDPRIVLIKNSENLGQTKALNKGILSSKGEYIARMDADDVAYPDRLNLQHGFISKDKSLAVVGSWHEEINEDGIKLRMFKTPSNPSEIRMYLIGSGALTYYCVSHPTVLIRKKALDKVGLYNEKYILQDYELWLRVAREYKIANINKALLKRRVLKNSLSRNSKDKIGIECDQIIMDNIYYYMPEINTHDCLPLKRMLKYELQASPSDGQKVLDLFDKFFDAVAGEESSDMRILKIRNRIKMYYLPRLFNANKNFAIKTAGKIIRKQPSILKDSKFYRKIMKAFFISTCENGNNDFIRKHIVPEWFSC